MTFSSDGSLRETREKMNKAVTFLEDELRGIRTGRATPALVENIHVEAYGAQQALKNVAQIMVPDPKSIQIKPFDASILKDIERAILASNLGITPGSDGKVIRLVMPPLTEERRKQLVHHVKELCEQQRISLRNLRRDVLKKADAAKKEHALTEDEHKKFDKQISDLLKDEEKKIDEAFKKKSEEVLAI
jgi:ribosome recycling factor